MRKISVFTLLLLSSFFYPTAHADEAYTRGYVIAVDTRNKAACETVRRKLRAVTTADTSHICDQDNKNPYTAIIATLSVAEFDFYAEEENLENNSTEISTNASSTTGAIYILPKYKEFDHFLHFTSHRDHAEITYSRQADFGNMAKSGKNCLIIPFIMKSNSETVATDDQSLSSSVNDYIVLNPGPHTKSQSQYLYIIKNQTNIIEILAEIVAEDPKDRVNIGLYSPKNLICSSESSLCKDGKFALGLNVKICF